MVGSFIVEAVKGMFQQVAKPSGELMNKEESAISPRVVDVARPPPPPQKTSNPEKRDRRWRDSWPILPAKRHSIKKGGVTQLDLPSKSAEDCVSDTGSFSSATKKLTLELREVFEEFSSWLEHFSNLRATANDKILEFKEQQAEAKTGDVSSMTPAVTPQIEGKPGKHNPDEGLDKKSDVGRERQHTPTSLKGPTPPASPLQQPVEKISQEYLDREFYGIGPPGITPPATPPPTEAAPAPIVSRRTSEREVADQADKKATPASPSSSVRTVPVDTSAPSTPREVATPPLSVDTKPASVAPSPAPSVIATNAAPQQPPPVNEQSTPSPAPSPQGSDDKNPSLVEGVTTPQSRPGSPRNSTASSVGSLPVTTENLARLNGTPPGAPPRSQLAGEAEDDNVSIASNDSGISGMSKAASSVRSDR
ncbi:hypothetical protein QFC22_001527 [Naganishia vaughanmartiniae]|uniref:Uncharacterized protein n=1 Tax=Naganishia vaughanmartiniae TaxID=1424756 RepID=A0ACC2XHL7_9TREE|nr:hypothetical protein QFC22_001527 [Naganishia vaughanmartiniae]